MVAIFLQVGSLEHVFLFEAGQYTHRGQSDRGSGPRPKANQDLPNDSNSTVMRLKEETCVRTTAKNS